MMIEKYSNKKKVLIIDDDKAVCEMLQMLLTTRGYNIVIANSAREAHEKISNSFDLVLLDLVLNDDDGLNVCRKFKENKITRQIPVIILSAKIQSNDIVEGLYLGADDYLTKPFDYEELVARMETVMRRGTFLNNDDGDSQSRDKIVSELKNIINNELIVPFYQPILTLKPMEILGFEILSRPYNQSTLSNPEILFKAAIEFGFYQDLELMSWKKALKYAKDYIHHEKMFLNCNPYLIEGPKFLTVKAFFDGTNFKENNFVLEITERSSISDYKVFFEKLNNYRKNGFKFAVDDVGGGYASLEAIVETRPEYLKIDLHIIRDIDKDPFKQSIVKFIVGFCRETNIVSIAEGIETENELETILSLGVDAGQGFFLFRPSPRIDFEEITHRIKELNNLAT